jgi:hypothetical protein
MDLSAPAGNETGWRGVKKNSLFTCLSLGFGGSGVLALTDFHYCGRRKEHSAAVIDRRLDFGKSYGGMLRIFGAF